ncbi:MAG: Deoxyuridine 5'-triphosphate nucleotidohydrolase [Candidatus Heimdallarchaeota archaeon LC_3]|nr:MAG: Deoxyuridine 5'-triphosphate nucleotidohydrolase [Candidatus Heimdallarchaeota archaeon LC_3]
MNVKVKMKLLDLALKIPSFAYPGDVALDLYSRITTEIKSREIKGIPTGIAIELPMGYEAQIRPRSGLAIKHGISLVNSPGTIDTDYRGEIVAIVVNLGKEIFFINKGDRICQMAVRKVPIVELEFVSELSKTSRGEKGFGSSGK